MRSGDAGTGEVRCAGQVALVTGAARRLGRAIALALAAAGADLAFGLRDVAADGGVPAEIEALGRRTLPLQMAIAQADQIGPALQSAAARFGRLDILVNNADIAPRNLAEDGAELRALVVHRRAGHHHAILGPPRRQRLRLLKIGESGCYRELPESAWPFHSL